MSTIVQSINEMIGSAIKAIPALLSAIIILLLTRFLAQFVEKVTTDLSKKIISSHSLRLLFVKGSCVLSWVTGIILASIIIFPGLRLGDVIATLGLSSVAIGFAFQDIFKNFLAGVLLLIQEPFNIGDQIIVEEYEGSVETINIRTTQIRTYQGERVLLPNSTVFTSAVQVRTAFDSRRTDLGIGVDYNTHLPQAKAILLKTISGIEGILESPKPEIDLVSFGDSSIDLVVRYWTKPSQMIVRRMQSQVIMAIKEAFDQEKIIIPYPIRTVYNYNQNDFNEYNLKTDKNQTN